MEGVDTKSNWCCWPFSLCCGDNGTPGERKLLNSEEEKKTPPLPRAMSDDVRSNGARTPGTTPTRSDTVKEQRMTESPDYV